MKENVDFRNIAKKVRFDLLGSIDLPLPSEFEKWGVVEQTRLYSRLFDLHHDMCCYLSSSLYLDELNSKYEEIKALYDNRNDTADD